MKGQRTNTTFTAISFLLLMSLISCNGGPAPEKGKANAGTGEVRYQSYTPAPADPDSTGVDTLFVQVAFDLDSARRLIVGKSKEYDPSGLHLLMVDRTLDNRLFFRSRGAYESYMLHPAFFRAEAGNLPDIVLVAQGTEDAWGQMVFLLTGEGLQEIGYMDVVRKETADTAFYEDGRKLSDIAPFTRITKRNGVFNFRFETDSILLYGPYGDRYDVVFPGNRISYTYNGDSLRISIRE